MNEDDIERKLRQETLASPSPGLDQRMDALFDSAASVNPRVSLLKVPVWLAAAACLVCGIAGFAARPLFVHRQTLPTVVVVVPPNEALARLLAGDQSRGNNDIDFSRAKVQIVNQPTRTSDNL